VALDTEVGKVVDTEVDKVADMEVDKVETLACCGKWWYSRMAT